MSEYSDVIQQIIDNYDGANGQYQKIDNAAESNCDLNQMVSVMPNMTLVRNRGGDVIGYDYIYTGPAEPNTSDMEVDSNSGISTFGGVVGGVGRYPGSCYGQVSPTTEGMSAAKGNNGESIVSGFIDAAWATVSTLAKLGKNVASDAADFIQSTGGHLGEAFNDLLVQSGDNAANVIRALFGVDSQGNTTMYLDEDTIGAIAITTRDDGYFNDTGAAHIDTEPADFPFSDVGFPVYISKLPEPIYIDIYNTNGTRLYSSWCYFLGQAGDDGVAVLAMVSSVFASDVRMFYNITSNNVVTIFLFSALAEVNQSYRLLALKYVNDKWTQTRSKSPTSAKYTFPYDNKVVYGKVETPYGGELSFLQPCTGVTNMTARQHLAWWACYGDGWIGGTVVPGVSNQDDATIPVDAITGADPHVVATNLVTQYPQVMGDPIQIITMDDSCNEVTHNYYSVPISYSPTNIDIGAPITGGLQVNPSFNPDVQIDLPDIDMSKYTEQVINQLQGSGAGRDVVVVNPDTGDVETIEGNTPATGDGVTPPETLPEVDVDAMWHIYNPSSSQLSALGSWLWSANVIDQIVRLFSNPMEAIIGVHALYAEPSVSGSSAIVVGNLTSSVSANIVNKQYTSVDCGSVWVTEYFGNAFDYDPYTKISLFLPFIGIVDLKVADVMRAKLSIKYWIDVYTGACLASVSVERDGVGGVLYQYPGCCAVGYPVSGANYSRMMQATIGAAASAVAVGMTPIGGLASTGLGAFGIRAGAAGATFATKGGMSVQRSGSFSANTGAMGIKKPYLIITRPQTNMAINFEKYDGRGSNYTAQIGSCSGYIKCKEVHLNVPGAYKDELDEIERLLKAGVLLSSQ